MKVVEKSAKDYETLCTDHFVIFESVLFNELNIAKCKQLLFLVFRDEGKNRFGLIAGLCFDGILKVPYSAPYSVFSEIRKNNKVKNYHEAVKALVNYCENREDIRGICFTLPPPFYAYTHIANCANALFCNKYRIDKLDLNFHLLLDSYTNRYIEDIDAKARQKLKASLKAGLTFVKASSSDEIYEAYTIIKNNRETKGYPLHLSFEDIVRTIKVVPADFFIVKDSIGCGIASAMIFYVTKAIVQVIYWGNIGGSDDLKPMNFLAYKVFEYYKSEGLKIVDIGPSTDNSIPNFGLCDFKQGIGCMTSSKVSFYLELD